MTLHKVEAEEIWEPVPGFSNYEISSQGRLRVLDRHMLTSNGQTRFYKGGLIAPCRNQHGHLKVMLVRTAGRKEPRYLHQLVMLAFVGPCPANHEVAHCDGNPSNNALSNLRYATPAENNADKQMHGTQPHGETHPQARLSENTVREILLRLSAGEKATAIAARFGVHKSTVGAIKRGRSWAHLQSSIAS